MTVLAKHGLELFLFVDEYDHFANNILVEDGEAAYRELTHGGWFFKTFFTLLKRATGGTSGKLARLFVTGVSPVAMDDVTSGFNIDISLAPHFNGLLGLEHAELDRLFAVFGQDFAAQRPFIDACYNHYHYTRWCCCSAAGNWFGARSCREGSDETIQRRGLIQTMTTTPYEQDYHAWAQETAHLIRQGRFLEVDIEHLAEEIEDMGASRERELESRLGVLLAHLLKWRYQPERRGASWEATIKEQRQRIVRLLRKNPSLTAKLEEIIQDAYSDARLIARRETGLAEETFPLDNPYAWELTIGDHWPEAA
ncbi:DUF29 family protein [Thiocystis violacea]|uniref:DUF29 family protein n=1 Tax=Thiocystis violacea TaxID=13725 RepID=UPI001906ED0E